ncbi:MAG TPA: hypothetical protein VN519_00730 [Bryobacteraceae bacterium]|nr:hypothetical protein [Bryobacteraceae bacterium]
MGRKRDDRLHRLILLPKTGENCGGRFAEFPEGQARGTVDGPGRGQGQNAFQSAASCDGDQNASGKRDILTALKSGKQFRMLADPAIQIALPKLSFPVPSTGGSKVARRGVPAKGDSIAGIENRPGRSTQEREKSANGRRLFLARSFYLRADYLRACDGDLR